MHREDPLPLRLYARALVILPRRFRESYGAGMAAMLADEWRERSGPGRGALLAGALVDLLWTAVVERIGGARRRRDRGAGMARLEAIGLTWLDFKVGFRMLIRYPGLTVVAGLTMAFAIAVGVGLFQLITLMVHPSLPLPDGERIVGLGYWDRAANDQAPTTADDVMRWRDALTTVEEIGAFDNFFDLVAALTVERFSLVFNADLAVNGDKTNTGEGYFQTLDDPMFWGLSLAAGYQATDLFGIALRGEILSDSDNQIFKATRENFGVVFPTTEQTNVVTATATLDFKPVDGSNNLVIRWDNRIETSNEEIFFNRSENPTNVWFGSILGLVVTTDG